VTYLPENPITRCNRLHQKSCLSLELRHQHDAVLDQVEEVVDSHVREGLGPRHNITNIPSGQYVAEQSVV